MKKINSWRLFQLFFILVPLFILFSFIKPEVAKIICQSHIGKSYPPAPPIKNFDWQGTGLITLWFDDAWISQYTSGDVQLMQQYGYVGALAVPTSFVCTTHFMDWDQIRDLQAKGWEITSHSVNHICDPAAYNNEKVTETELRDSKKELEFRGLHAENYVQPCGYNKQVVPEVVAAAKEIYASYRESGEQINPLPVIDPYAITSFAVTDTTTEADVKKWVEEAKAKKGWLVIMIHQIDNRNLRYNISPEMFKKILDIIKNSRLPVVLPTQALAIGADERKEKKGAEPSTQKTPATPSPNAKTSDDLSGMM